MKKALKYKEYSIAHTKLMGKTTILDELTDKTFRKGKTICWYVLRFKEFADLPLFLKFIHDEFGQSVEVEVYSHDRQNGIVELYIRGYNEDFD